MRNLARKSIPLLVALSLTTMTAVAGAQDVTNKEITSTRDPHSTWVITTPSRQHAPVNHRFLIGDAHRRIEPSSQAAPEVYKTAAEAQAAGARKAKLVMADAGATLTSFPTIFSSFVNDALIEPFGAGFYTFVGMRVGTDPATSNRTTTVPTYVVPVIVVGTDGKVYNPNTVVSGLNESTIDIALHSPVLTPTSLQFGGHNFGTTQLMDAWTRASDWADLSTKGAYHLMLGTPTVLPALRLTPTAAQFQSLNFGPGSGLYHSTIGVLDINYLDDAIRTYIAHEQKTGALSTTGVPIFLTSYNIEADGAGGYHDTDVNQVYTWVGTFISSAFTGTGYNDNKASPVRDGVVLEHEFAELIDHPFVETGDNGPCSYWGYEVGDPLESGQNDFELTAANGNSYQFQDLTFYSYNVGDTTSKGIHGWYTLQNTYTRACSGL